jgi:hypothetical protein
VEPAGDFQQALARLAEQDAGEVHRLAHARPQAQRHDGKRAAAGAGVGDRLAREFRRREIMRRQARRTGAAEDACGEERLHQLRLLVRHHGFP